MYLVVAVECVDSCWLNLFISVYHFRLAPWLKFNPVPGLVALRLHNQVSITKEHCTVVGDGRTQKEVAARVKQIRNLAADTEQDYEKEKLNERIARLSGGVAIIQVRLSWNTVANDVTRGFHLCLCARIVRHLCTSMRLSET